MMKNCKKMGLARVIIFPVKNKFRAVCLDFDIVEDADTLVEADKQIKEAITGYIINVCKNNLDDALLNRHADKKYWDKYFKAVKYAQAKNEEKTHASKDVRSSSVLSFPISEIFKSYACA